MNLQGTVLNSDARSLPTTTIAISSSEVIASVLRQAQVAQASGNPRKAIQVGLQHLARNGLISGEELRTLSRMCDLAMIVGAGGKGRLAAVEQLRQLHDALVVKSSGPVAVSVAGAIVQRFASNDAGATTQPLSRAATARLGRNPAAGFVGALIVGGVIGGLIGGVPGIAVGIVGGAVGALTDCSGSD